MREVVWALVGWFFGIGAARRARIAISRIHLDGGGYVHGFLNTRAGFTPAVSILNAVSAFGIATTLQNNITAFAFVVFSTNIIQQMNSGISTGKLIDFKKTDKKTNSNNNSNSNNSTPNESNSNPSSPYINKGKNIIM